MSNRIIYQSEAVFVGNSPATGSQTDIVQLYRVTSQQHSWNVAHVDVNQLGELAAIDRIILAAPTVTFEATYHVSNVLNESNIGLYVGGDHNCLKYIMDTTQDTKNYWVRIVPEGNDAAGYTGTDGGVIGIGNGYLSAYNTQGAVGAIPSATVRFEANNARYDISSTGISTPALNPTDGVLMPYSVSIPVASSGVSGQISAIQPGQIIVDMQGAGLGVQNMAIQSYNLAVDLRREPLLELGMRFPWARLITFPITATMDVEANWQDLAQGNLSDILCNDRNYNVSVSLYAPACSGATGALKAQYQLLGAKLDSQSATSSIGPQYRITMKFSAQIGGPQDNVHGLFIAGSLN